MKHIAYVLLAFTTISLVACTKQYPVAIPSSVPPGKYTVIMMHEAAADNSTVADTKKK